MGDEGTEKVYDSLLDRRREVELPDWVESHPWEQA